MKKYVRHLLLIGPQYAPFYHLGGLLCSENPLDLFCWFCQPSVTVSSRTLNPTTLVMSFWHIPAQKTSRTICHSGSCSLFWGSTVCCFNHTNLKLCCFLHVSAFWSNLIDWLIYIGNWTFATGHFCCPAQYINLSVVRSDCCCKNSK